MSSRRDASAAHDTTIVVVPARAAGTRLDVALAALFPELSRRAARAAIARGDVELDGHVIQVASRSLASGARLALPRDLAPELDLPELPLLDETPAWAAFMKPPGMLSEPAVSTDAPGALRTALELARSRFVLGGGGTFAACVGRLDRPVSGLILVAKSGEAHGRLVRSLQRGDAGKHYLAITDGSPEANEGVIDLGIRRAGVVHFEAVTEGVDAKPARTEYRVLARSATSALAAVRLLTGRTHQARLHLAAIGAPIAGDTRYGRAGADGERDPEVPTKRIFLHAHRLSFLWENEPVTLEAAPPEDFVEEAVRRGLSSVSRAVLSACPRS